VLVTRRSPELVSGLSALGATVSEVPTIRVAPVDDAAPLDHALRRLHEHEYDWLVFTSAHAVGAVADRMRSLRLALPARVRLASIGGATTLAITAAWPNARVDVQPRAEFRGASLVNAFARTELADRRVLLPVSDRATDTVPRGLAAAGARVDRVMAYRTLAAGGEGQLRDVLGQGIDAAAFASPSAVESFLSAAGDAGLEVPAVVIGPTTADAARAAGLTVLAVATPSTMEGLVRAVARALGGRPPSVADP
jgi:uroporphyrinogen-III synthase